MDMVTLGRLLEEMRTGLQQTRIPDDQVPLIVGAAAGVIVALTRS